MTHGYIYIYDATGQVGTIIDSGSVESYNIYAGSGQRLGHVMHGVENSRSGHTYGCWWSNSSTLQFYIDYANNGGAYQCWINSGTSDKRLKHDIKNVDEKLLDMLDELETKEFILDSDETNKKRIGYIAQDILELAEKYEINIMEYYMIFQQDNEYYYVDYEQIENLKILCLERKIKKLEEKIAKLS